MVGVSSIWSAFKSIVLLEERVRTLASASKDQQQKIQDLTGRVIRLEAQLDLLTMAAFTTRPQRGPDEGQAIAHEAPAARPRISSPDTE